MGEGLPKRIRSNCIWLLPMKRVCRIIVFSASGYNINGVLALRPNAGGPVFGIS